MRVVLSVVAVCVAAVMVGATISGCQPDSSSGPNGSSAGDAAAVPASEAQFQRVVDMIRKAIDTNASGAPTGFVIRDQDGGRTTLSVRSEVTDELIKPSKEGEPYRGTITVAYYSSYSMRKPNGESGDNKSNGQHDQQDTSGLDSDGDVEVLDQNLMAAATKTDNPSPIQSDEMVARRTDEDVRTYELEYRNGRWALTTELDPETEQSIQYAFDHALAAQ